MLITLHHNYSAPLFHVQSANGFDRNRSDMTDVLLHGQLLDVASGTFQAVAVVWRAAEIGIPLSIALPNAGESLRTHLESNSKSQHGRRAVFKSRDARLHASFSLAYAPTILCHGWYRADYLHRLANRAPDRSRNQTAGNHTAASHSELELIHPLPADADFASEYFHSQFYPDTKREFPLGTKPIGRQLHVYPVVVGRDKHFLLSVVTDWDLRGDASSQLAQLEATLATLVKRLGGTVVFHDASKGHLKYETGCDDDDDLVDPGAYSLDRLARDYEVAVLQQDASSPVEFISRRGSVRGTLTSSEFDELLAVVIARDAGARFKKQKHFLKLRNKLEPGHRFASTHESPYWKPLFEPGDRRTIPRFRFQAERYIIVIPKRIADDGSTHRPNGRRAPARRT